MKTPALTLICCLAALGATCHAAPPVVVPLGSYSQHLQAPVRAAADAGGNLYVVNPLAGQIVVFDSFGRRRETRAGFVRPLGIAVDPQGRIYIAEELAGRVSVFDDRWNPLYTLGAGDGEFQLPSYLAIAPASASNAVYVTDSLAGEVKVYIGPSRVNRFGSRGSLDGQFDFPTGVCISTGGEVFVVDQANDRVQVFALSGAFKRKYRYGGMLGPSGRKQGVVVDGAGRLYVADTFQGFVKAYDAATGTFLSNVGEFGPLSAPAGLAMDAWGTLYVASANSGEVRLYGLDAFVHLVGEPAAGVVAAGTDFRFRAVTGGAGPFAFQWLKDGIGLPAATNATLAILGAGDGDAGGYSAVVAGPFGAYTSSVARVAVMAAPAIVSQPQNLTVFRGESAQFAVVATGSLLAYQWRVNGSDLAGATNSVLNLTEVQTVDGGAYSVGVRNAVGNIASVAAQLTVLVPPTMLEFVSCGVHADQQLQLTVNVDPGYTFALEASTNRYHWDPLATLANNAGLIDIMDADATNFWRRFYRVRWTP